MKISSRVDYAISCLIVIAAETDSQKPISVKHIAEKEDIEVDYVEQLLIVMKRAGILQSRRGVKGGYLLAREAEEITAFDIVRSFEGEVLELVCFRAKGRRSACIHLADCEVRSFWNGLRGCIQTYLEKTTLEELVALRAKEKKKG
jgi:Rrf2 family transcriptional regulator, iron-sulfur cluster assembly transcription factor